MYYLAIDIGASSGRHILGRLVNGVLHLDEIHRFENGPKKSGGKLVWDIEYLFSEILKGIKKCKELDKIPRCLAIDTWGVDYVLLDKSSKPILPAYSYRDLRTREYLDTNVPYSELYKITGTQQQVFNTIYQLLADKAEGRLEKADSFLMLPEYFNYLLTGVKKREYSEASTTGLLDAKTKDWAYDLIEQLGLPKSIFSTVEMPGAILGSFTDEIQREVGFDCDVIMCAAHDTASAVAAVPSENPLYISSGTWSLLGIEGEPILTDDARNNGYTNEGAENGRIRFLKNIMGLWIIQQVRHELKDEYSFSSIAQMAENEAVYDWNININDPLFFSPVSMIETIKAQCVKEGQPVPKTVGEIAHCVYNSLSYCFKDAIEALQNITKRKFDTLCIVGGGCKNEYLNRLTAKNTKMKVLAGPEEATAVGNLIVQMKTLEKKTGTYYKDLIKKSFKIKEISNV